MRTIYVDGDFHCHAVDDGTRTAVETAYFDGKCDAFLEGYCCRVRGKGLCIYPWQDYETLRRAQRAYEKSVLRDYAQLIDQLYEEVTG